MRAPILAVAWVLAHATVLVWKVLDPRYIDEAQWIAVLSSGTIQGTGSVADTRMRRSCGMAGAFVSPSHASRLGNIFFASTAVRLCSLADLLRCCVSSRSFWRAFTAVLAAHQDEVAHSAA